MKVETVVAWTPVRCTNGKRAWLRPVHRVTGEWNYIYLDPRDSILQQDGFDYRHDPRAPFRRDLGAMFVIPSCRHLYPTCGDWSDDGQEIVVHVSDLGEWRSEWCVAIHELIEALICRQTGVDPAAVTAFDIMFEGERAGGLHGEGDEPGDDPRAPYRDAHRFATKIELMMSEKLGLSWVKHEQIISSNMS